MTKEELAEKLNGREYGEEITVNESDQAKADGLLVIYGASDDLIEFAGLMRDEAECWGGAKIMFDAKGVFPGWEEADLSNEAESLAWSERRVGVKTVEAVWHDEPGEPAWSYKTDVPHATFEIWDDGAVYCRGLVIDGKDLS